MNLNQSLHELDQSLKELTTHFLYSEEIAEKVVLALNQDAISHSNKAPNRSKLRGI